MNTTRRLLIVFALLLGFLLPASLTTAAPRVSDIYLRRDTPTHSSWIEWIYYADATRTDIVGANTLYCDGTRYMWGEEPPMWSGGPGRAPWSRRTCKTAGRTPAVSCYPPTESNRLDIPSDIAPEVLGHAGVGPRATGLGHTDLQILIGRTRNVNFRLYAREGVATV